MWTAHVLAVGVLTAGSSALLAQDTTTVRLGVGFAIQSQTTGQPRSGLAGALSLWFGHHALFRTRLEVGFGGYSLVGGGLLCADICRRGPDGFPELLTGHVGLAVGPQGRPRRVPMLLAGLTAIHGFGNEKRQDRDALVPDLGLAIRLWETTFVEVRQRWLHDWEGGPFSQFSLGLAWRHP
jgi:hypothetical protein